MFPGKKTELAFILIVLILLLIVLEMILKSPKNFKGITSSTYPIPSSC